MFSVLISASGTAWETDQLMRMLASRFKEYSEGHEASSVTLDTPDTLKLLEEAPALLMYETNTEGPNADVIRYGHVRDIRVAGNELVFRFAEEGRFSKSVVQEFADRLGVDKWEQTRTHWAIKDGGIPHAMLAKLLPSYDVVLSFAGEDREYVEHVAEYLRSKDVKVFYDGFEEANLWGKDLAEHLGSVYRRSGKYCVVFISKWYSEKMWTRHERRSALARALQDREEYILPARFDETELPGILPTVGYISLSDKSPIDFGKLILEKLRRS
jgi:TIR domain